MINRLAKIIDTISYPFIYALNRPIFNEFNKLILLFGFKINGAGISWSHKSGISKNEYRFLRNHAKVINGGLVFDVGANVGHYANAVKSLCPDAKIICFEPQPKTFEKLCQNCPSPNITTEKKALCDKIGSAKLYELVGYESSSVASLTADTLRTFGSVGTQYDVMTDTIDNYCKKNNIKSIRLLKIDSEGHDLDVLRGAEQMIRSAVIDMIEFEFIPANIYTNVHFYQFCEILEGYDLYRLCLNGRLTSMCPYDYRFSEFYIFYTVIAIRKGFLNR